MAAAQPTLGWDDLWAPDGTPLDKLIELANVQVRIFHSGPGESLGRGTQPFAEWLVSRVLPRLMSASHGSARDHENPLAYAAITIRNELSALFGRKKPVAEQKPFDREVVDSLTNVARDPETDDWISLDRMVNDYFLPQHVPAMRRQVGLKLSEHSCCPVHDCAGARRRSDARWELAAGTLWFVNQLPDPTMPERAGGTDFWDRAVAGALTAADPKRYGQAVVSANVRSTRKRYRLCFYNWLKVAAQESGQRAFAMIFALEAMTRLPATLLDSAHSYAAGNAGWPPLDATCVWFADLWSESEGMERWFPGQKQVADRLGHVVAQVHATADRLEDCAASAKEPDRSTRLRQLSNRMREIVQEP